MNDKQKQTIIDASSILIQESRFYYDDYQKRVDATSKGLREEAFKAFEKYKELNRIALELSIIAGGL